MLKGSRERGEVFAFDALRCDHSPALARHSGRRVCEEVRIKADNGMTVKVPAGELRVLQLEQGVRFQATLCKKKRSTMKAVCGASWHSKLGEPLDVQETARLSITDCGEISTQRTPAGEGARRVPGPEGSRAMHKYPDTGGATLFDGVVDCVGSEFRVGGRERSNVVEFVTIGYSIAAVEVTEVEG